MTIKLIKRNLQVYQFLLVCVFLILLLLLLLLLLLYNVYVYVYVYHLFFLVQETTKDDIIKQVLSVEKRDVKIYWGTATTGRIHVAYFVPMSKVKSYYIIYIYIYIYIIILIISPYRISIKCYTIPPMIFYTSLPFYH